MAYTLKTAVSSHDIDTNCNATPSALLRYFGEAVDSNMREYSPSYQELFDSGLSFIVSRTAVRIFRPIKEYEALSVSTWATEAKGAAFPRSYIIEADGERVAECVMIWALLDMKEKRLLRGSDFDVSRYGVGEVLELSSARLRLPRDIEMNRVGSVQVHFRDIDRNYHMNNTKYYDLLFGYVPDFDKYYMKECLLNFVGEAKLGDGIEIFISEAERSESGELSYYFKTEVSGKTNIEAKITLERV